MQYWHVKVVALLVMENYLYMVSDEGTTNLKIADLSTLPGSTPIVYDNSSLFTTSHNIFIDTLSGYLYATNGRVLSLADPVNPQNASFSGSGGHDFYVQHDTLYVHNGNTGFFIYDYSNPVLHNTSIVTLLHPEAT